MVPVRRHARHWAAYLAGGGLGLVLLLKKYSPRKIQTQQNTDCQNQGPYNLNKKETPGNAYKDYDHSTEAEHRTTEQFSWKSQKTVSFWTLIAAIVAVALSFGSLVFTGEQAYIAQQSLVQANRAWINVDIDTTSVSISWIDGSPVVAATITRSNEGSSPALDVIAYPYIFVGEAKSLDNSRIGIRGRIKSYCASSGSLGNIMFTKESQIQTVEVAAKDELQDGTLNFLRQAIPKEQSFSVPLSIIACATYHIVGDKSLHFTSKVYIAKVKTMFSDFADPIVGENMPKGSVFMTRQIQGENAD